MLGIPGAGFKPIHDRVSKNYRSTVCVVKHPICWGPALGDPSRNSYMYPGSLPGYLGTRVPKQLWLGPVISTAFGFTGIRGKIQQEPGRGGHEKHSEVLFFQTDRSNFTDT
eukprot:2959698-Rhodomonas_salina.2